MELKQVVSKLFAVYGYSVTEREDGILVALSSSKDNIKIAINYSDKPVTKQNISVLQSAEHEAFKRIFISQYGFEPEAVNFAKESNIILWDKEFLEREIGKAVLADKNDIFFKTGEKKEIFLKCIVKKEDAKALAESLSITSIALVFQPYYTYDYTCEVLAEGSLDMKKNTGTVAINGVTGVAENLPQNAETEKEDAVYGYTKHPTEINEEKAVKIAKQVVKDFNTKVVEIKDERNTAVIFEKKRIAPKDEAVTLNFKGLCYLPFWTVKGKFGSAVISGVSGRIIKQDLTPAPGLVDEKIEVV